MRSLGLLLACSAGLALLAPTVSAFAQNSGAYATEYGIQHHRRHAMRVARPQGHIACDKYGCHPIPPGCYPEPGFDWRGNPTGYDVTVCR